MIKVTIQVPDELASRLEPVQDRLIEVIELGLREIESAQYELHDEVIEFLASGPSPEAIVSFRPSEEAQARVAELLERNRKGALPPAEESELDQYEDLDYLMTLVKARARQHLSKVA